MGEWVVLAAAGLIVLRGAMKGVDVYAAFVRGGRSGMESALGLLPALCAMTVLTALLNASGLGEMIAGLLAPLLELLHLPRETAMVFVLRPMSGSGSMTALQQVFAACGADSRAGRAASVLMSASETILYTMTVYLGATNVKKLPWVLPVSLASYLAGAAVCGLMV